jgi:predicted dehydrogenase
MTSRKVKTALVGCGAMTRLAHLPASLRSPNCELTLLVDTDIDRARVLARPLGVDATDNLADLAGEVEAAVVVVPHHVHVSVGTELMRSGISVLLEKPMAVSASECDELISVAKANDCTLDVALIRRQFWNDLMMRTIVEQKWFGDPTAFSITDGGSFDWPSETDFILKKKESGGGVLIGNGSHILDLVSWVFSHPESVSYKSDSAIGMEADCSLQLFFDEFEGSIELSRTRNLGNEFVVCFKGTEIRSQRFSDEIGIWRQDKLVGKLTNPVPDEDKLEAAATRQLTAFLESVMNKSGVAETATNSNQCLQTIEHCYATRIPVDHPWDQIHEA